MSWNHPRPVFAPLLLLNSLISSFMPASAKASETEPNACSTDPIYVGSLGVAIDLPSCAGHIRQLDAAIRKATFTASTCLTFHNPTLAYRFLAHLAKNTPEILCLNPAEFAKKGRELSAQSDDESGRAGQGHSAQSGGQHVCALGDVGGNRIYLHPLAFNPSACGPLASVLFHEFLHNISVMVPSTHSPQDHQDGIYGCQETCFSSYRSPGRARRVTACEAAH
ncbi:MAG: hypothetical protein AAB425_04085 [Bdellovibrionota bacterium]